MYSKVATDCVRRSALTLPQSSASLAVLQRRCLLQCGNSNTQGKGERTDASIAESVSLCPHCLLSRPARERRGSQSTLAIVPAGSFSQHTQQTVLDYFGPGRTESTITTMSTSTTSLLTCFQGSTMHCVRQRSEGRGTRGMNEWGHEVPTGSPWPCTRSGHT